MTQRFLLLFALLYLSVACERSGAPVPIAYFRIALPEKEYQLLDQDYPYRFKYPVYTSFEPDTRETAEAYWADIVFGDFSGRLHLSYKAVDNEDQLYGYFEDARTFVHRHIPKATAIRDEPIVIPENRVYGMLFHIRGKEAASPLQFYATDSVSHFLRGALYFNVRPNNDSLAPVIDFIEEDIRHLFVTLNWR